ncbi:MAG TPA: hypothetical protein VFB54_14515 [Burkholderiales bacterium]|nr:hypothetical protein [Burkholderiales bacterium]
MVLNLRLLDSETHIQLWAHRLELSAPGDHGYLVELTDPVRRALLAAEMTRAQRSVGEAPPDLVSRGWARMETGNYSNASVREALTFFDRALERDPQNVAALVSKALAVKETFDADLRTDRSSIAAEMDDLTRRAIAIDRGDASAWNARSIALFWQGRYDEALEANAEAQRLDPSRHQLVAVRAFLLLGVGAADEALQSATQAMRLARTATEYDARMACWAILALRRYVEAAEQCAKAAALGNGWWLDEAFTTAAFAKAGQIDAARARAARLLAIRPDLKTSVLRAHRYSDHPAFRQWWEGELLDGLTKAGVPE